MPRRHSPRSDHLRRALAQEAARLMAEHGIHDFRLAKQKAADRLGITDEGVLPRNTEIEEALAEHQRLFAGARHAQWLAAQRQAALRAMQSLKAFSPRLVGPVLNGTATEHSDVQLHLFSDNPDAVTLTLLDRGVQHEVGERRLRLDPERVAAYPSVRFEQDEHLVEATVFPVDGIRQAPVSPVDGRPMRRADVHELESLISAG